jgi:hypothetical protein
VWAFKFKEPGPAGVGFGWGAVIEQQAQFRNLLHRMILQVLYYRWSFCRQDHIVSAHPAYRATHLVRRKNAANVSKSATFVGLFLRPKFDAVAILYAPLDARGGQPGSTIAAALRPTWPAINRIKTYSHFELTIG